MTFNPEEFIYVRGLPFERAEIVLHQERLGAQLIDESLFREMDKKQAAANIIRVCDYKLKEYLQKHGRPDSDEIIALDIGDPSWLYVPVWLFPPNGTVIVMPTKDRPAGLVAWFRMKKMYGGYNVLEKQ